MLSPCHCVAQVAVIGALASSWLMNVAFLMPDAWRRCLFMAVYLMLRPYSSLVLPMKTGSHHQTPERSWKPYGPVQVLQFPLSPSSCLRRSSRLLQLILEMTVLEPVDLVHCLLRLSSSCSSGILLLGSPNYPIPMSFGYSTLNSNFSCSYGLYSIKLLANSLSGLEHPSC